MHGWLLCDVPQVAGVVCWEEPKKEKTIVVAPVCSHKMQILLPSKMFIVTHVCEFTTESWWFGCIMD